MLSRMRRGFSAGLRASLGGLRLGSSSQEVRKTYVQLVLALFAMGLLLDIAGVWAVWHFTATAADAAWWAVIGWWAVRIAGLIVVLLAAPLLSLGIVNAVFPFLGERVFLAALRVVDPARADALASLPGTPLVPATLVQLRRLAMFALLSIGIFFLSLVPVVGQIAGPVLSTYATSRGLAWELLDPYFDKLQLGYAAQGRVVAQHRAALVGFGLPLAWIMAIPLVGPLFFGLAQGAAARLVVDVIEAEPTPAAG